MVAADLKTSANLYSISIQERVSDALAIVEHLQLRHVILLDDDGRLAGLISEETLLEYDAKTVLGDVRQRDLTFVTDGTHIFDLFAKMIKGRISVIPVMTEGNISGAILFTSMCDALLEELSLDNAGELLILEVSRSDYSLASIARILETEGYKVLMSSTKQLETANYLVTLRVNDVINSMLLNSLERYGYTVLASYSQEGAEAMWRDRYESLMNYLNV